MKHRTAADCHGEKSNRKQKCSSGQLGGVHTVHSCGLLHKFEPEQLLLQDDEKRFDKKLMSCEENTQIRGNLDME